MQPGEMVCPETVSEYPQIHSLLFLRTHARPLWIHQAKKIGGKNSLQIISSQVVEKLPPLRNSFNLIKLVVFTSTGTLIFVGFFFQFHLCFPEQGACRPLFEFLHQGS